MFVVERFPSSGQAGFDDAVLNELVAKFSDRLWDYVPACLCSLLNLAFKLRKVAPQQHFYCFALG